MSSNFLPKNLTPQGWLNDILMTQLYVDKGVDADKDSLHAALLGDMLLKQTGSKLIFLHPALKNDLEAKHFQKAPNYQKNTKKQPSKADIKYQDMIKKAHSKFLKDLTPAQVASMVPYIRMFIRSKKKGEKWKKAKERDVIFKVYADTMGLNTRMTLDGAVKYDPKELLFQNFEKGEGAGIKEMQITRQYPSFGITNSFFVNINFFFRSFKIFAEGARPKGVTLYGDLSDDYIKLIANNLGAEDAEVQHKLFVEYGWAYNDENELIPDVYKEGTDYLTGLRKIIRKEERKVFELTWQSHSFSIQQNGEVALNVKYVGIPEKQLKETSEERVNNVLLVQNQKLFAELDMDADIKRIHKRIKDLTQRIKTLTKKGGCAKEMEEADRQQALARGATPPPKTEKELKKDEEIKKLSYELEKSKLEVASKAHWLFLQWLIVNKQLFHIKFKSFQKGKKPKTQHIFDWAIYRADAELVKNVITPQSVPIISDADDADASDKMYYLTEELDYNNVFGPKFFSEAAEHGIEYVGEVCKGENKEAKFKEKFDDILAALTNSHNSNIHISYEKDKKGKQTSKVKSGSTYGNFCFLPLRAIIAACYNFAGSSVEQKVTAIIEGPGINKKSDLSNEFKQMPMVLLGNMVYRALGKKMWVNIGDLMVDAGVFQRWLYSTVLAKGVNSITFGSFLESIMSDLVPAILAHSHGFGNSNLGNIIKEDWMISETAYEHGFKKSAAKVKYKKLQDAYSERKKDYIAPYDLYTHPDSPAEPNEYILRWLASAFKGAAHVNDAMPFIYYHQRSTSYKRNTDTELLSTPLLKSVEKRSFNVKEDEADGMYQLNIGEAKGMLREIKFSYSDMPALQTALMLSQQKDSAIPYLKYAYRADAELIGNNLFHKAGFFTLPIQPLGIDYVQDPGLSGYYRIDSVVDKVAMGHYTTTVSAQNVHSPALKNQEEKARQEAGCKKAKAKKPKPIPTTVHHDIKDYIMNVLLKDVRFAKAYDLKIKKTD